MLLLFVLVFLGDKDGTVQFVNKPLLFWQVCQILTDLDVRLIKHQQFDVLGVAFAA